MKRSLSLTIFLLAMGIVDGGLLAAEGAVEAMMVPPAVKRVAGGDPLADRLSGAAERQLKRRGRKVSDRVPLRETGVEQRIFSCQACGSWTSRSAGAMLKSPTRARAGCWAISSRSRSVRAANQASL